MREIYQRNGSKTLARTKQKLGTARATTTMWRSTLRTAKGAFREEERQSGPEARSSRESAANVGSKATRRQSVAATRKFASNAGRKTTVPTIVENNEDTTQEIFNVQLLSDPGEPETFHEAFS